MGPDGALTDRKIFAFRFSSDKFWDYQKVNIMRDSRLSASKISFLIAKKNLERAIFLIDFQALKHRKITTQRFILVTLCYDAKFFT